MCMYDPDGEWPEFYRQTTHKARKSHRCCECGRTIEPGEEYELVVGKWHGDMDRYKTCGHCLSVREWLVKVCSGFNFTDVREDLTEHFREGYGVWLGRASIGMKRRWRRRDGSLRPPMTLPADMPVAH